jgi:hypothetical protein
MLASVLRPLKYLCDDLGLLWVSGLALLQLYLGSKWLSLQGEAYEWAQYLLLGTAFPATLLVLSLVRPSGRWAPPLARALQLGLAAVCLTFSFLFIRSHFSYGLWLAVAAQWALYDYFAPLLSGPADQEERPRRDLSGLLMMVFVAGISWFASERMMSWWAPPFGEWITHSFATAVVFALSLLLVVANLSCRGEAPATAAPAHFFSPGNLAALLIIALSSVRAPDFPNPVTHHHWGHIIGSAELVRQGGWLLWDVPSQYGFLCTLALAWLPTASVWQSLYVLNALLLFLSASFLFFTLRGLRTGYSNLYFSLAVTLAAVFLVPGFTSELSGPAVVPSVGALRFFWCYALLAVLVWEFRTEVTSRSHWLPPVVGCAVWLGGVFWSSESAAFSIAIWAPAYVVMVWRRVVTLYPKREQWPRRLRAGLLWGLLPVVLLLGSLGALKAYYRLRLGHGPDWRAFIDYTVGSSGFFAEPIDPNGGMWALFFVFCVLSTAAVYALEGRRLAALSLMAGAWGALWSASSYFVGRSHDANITNLCPILCTGLALVLYVFARDRTAGRLSAWARMSCVPLLTIVLTYSFGNTAAFPGYFASLTKGYQPSVESGLAEVDASLNSLLAAVRLNVGDPLLYSDGPTEGEPVYHLYLPRHVARDGEGNARLSSSHRAWLPTAPFGLLEPLPLNRREVYLSRFIARTRLSGWLVKRKNNPDPFLSWYIDRLRQTHTPFVAVEVSDWKVTWFAFNDDPNYPAPDQCPFAGEGGEGTLDVVAADQITGWAWDPEQPNRPVTVDIFDGDEKLVTLLADTSREDLVLAQKGNGKHGFSFAPPAALKDGKPHPIRVVLSGTGQELAGSPKTLQAAPAATVPPAPGLDDAQLARAIRQAAGAALPADAAVLVVSYGDDDLLKLGGRRRAGHFPQAKDGGHDNSKPADSAEAIAWLEKLRAKGGYRFLLFPETAFWWLDHYKGFREYLESRYRRIQGDRHCIIYQLTEPKPG